MNYRQEMIKRKKTYSDLVPAKNPRHTKREESISLNKMEKAYVRLLGLVKTVSGLRDRMHDY
jgi:hypothetical protein